MPVGSSDTPSPAAAGRAGEGLPIKVYALIQQQKKEWELAKTNYAGLAKIESRTFNFDGFQIVAQFNPERIRSSAAKTDDQSIQQRPCFLCVENQPKEQLCVDFREKYTLLINPYPIFPAHLTIPLNQHLIQEIEPYFSDMLDLSKELPDFTIFYNGPKCGASAPDHFHFQAGSKGMMPVENEINAIASTNGELLFKSDQTMVTAIGNKYLRKLILLQSSSKTELARHFQKILIALKETGQDGEPMMNILANFENGRWRIILFPRDKQRPTQFYAEGDERILMSPASAEMGGLVILPRKEDFKKLTKNNITDIYKQVTMNEHDFEKLKIALAVGGKIK